jgi:hypothetical protein
MNNIKIHCGWDLKFDLFHEKQVELYVDAIPPNKSPEGTVRFLFMLEPPEIMPHLQAASLGAIKSGQIDYILTHNQVILDKSDKAFMQEFATSWIQGYKFPEKKYETSALIGGKIMAEGHHLRQQLLGRVNEIVTPKKIWLSGNFPVANQQSYSVEEFPRLEQNKAPLFESQFHFCIENAKRDNWFTEKLMDCFQTKTAPIYWGCPNIGNWFDTRGMVIVNSVDEMIQAVNQFNDQTYNEMLPYIEKNFEISNEFTDIASRLKTNIENIITI